MGKGNLLQGMGRGKLGDTVFYRSNGEQMYRVRNRRIKNPKTSAQTIQRAVVGTVAKLYSALRPICDHSFEGVEVGAKCQAMFSRVNVPVLSREVKSFKEGTSFGGRVAAKGINAIPQSDLWVSKGSLINPIVIESDGVGKTVVTNNPDDWKKLKEGDMLTYVAYKVEADVDLSMDLTGEEVTKASCCLSSPKLIVQRFTRNAVAWDHQGDAWTSTELAKFFDYQSDDDTTLKDSFFALSIDSKNEGDNCCSAVILSRYSNGKWLRSSERLLVPELQFGITPEYLETAWNPAQSRPSSDLILNGGPVE